MGGFFSRTGTDTYYANYEKAFERLERESVKISARRGKRRKTVDACSNVGFWIQAVGFLIAVVVTAYLQKVNSQKWYQKSVTILGAFAVPAVAALLLRVVLWTLRFIEARDERFLRKLMDAKRKMVKDLKDSTRFDKTAALIKKYDPDEQAASAQVAAAAAAPAGPTPGSGGLRRRPSASSASDVQALSASQVARLPSVTSGSMLIRPAAAAASAAVSVAAETGKALMPMFESLANNLVGDSPALLQEAHQLRQENSALRARIAELEAKLAEVSATEEPEEPAETFEKGQVASSG